LVSRELEMEIQGMEAVDMKKGRFSSITYRAIQGVFAHVVAGIPRPVHIGTCAHFGVFNSAAITPS
jgi:hypothetical protein